MAVVLSFGLALSVGCSGDDGEDVGGSGSSTGYYDTSMGSDGDAGITDTATDTADGGDGETITELDGGDSSETGDDGGDTMEPDADPDAGCGNQTCGDDEICVDEQCLTANQTKCKEANEIGSISPGAQRSISGSFRDPYVHGIQDALETSCAGSEDAPEKIYKFEVTEATQVAYTAQFNGEFDAKLEFRQGSCLTDGDGIGEYGTCRGTSAGEFYAPAGSTWYLVLENDAGLGKDFTVDLEGKQACSFAPVGEFGCKGDDRALCEADGDQTVETVYTCPTTCTDAECNGSSCQNPIVVGGGGSSIYSGDIAGFPAEFNFKNKSDTTCYVGGVEYDARGQEVFFKLPNLKAGDQIEVDADAADDKNVNAVYVTRSCTGVPQSMTCIATGDEQLVETVEEPGDYYVIVDKGNQTSGDPFHYEVKVK